MSQHHRYDGTLHILLMDDEDNILKALSSLLNAMGHEVSTASKGEELLAHIDAAETVPDLAILDIRIIGGMGGIETAKNVQMLGIDMPMISMSGYQKEILFKNSEDLAMFAGHLSKPFGMASLKKEIERVCHRLTS